jgi:hypothetical protein
MTTMLYGAGSMTLTYDIEEQLIHAVNSKGTEQYGSRRAVQRDAAGRTESGAGQGQRVHVLLPVGTPLGEGKFKIKGFHTSDLPLTMRLVRFPESEQLSHQLSSAWAAFDRTGNPSQKGYWCGPLKRLTRATMVFDAVGSKAVNAPDKDERLFLRSRPSGGLL